MPRIGRFAPPFVLASYILTSTIPLAAAQSESLSVSLSASVTTAAAPLSTTLTATIGGTATGTANYTFWWNCSDPGTSVSSVASVCGNPANAAIGAKFDDVADTSKTVGHTYQAEGAYTAKVIAERGSAPPAEMRLAITAVAPPVARDDVYTVVAGSTLSVPAPGVLANDTVPAGYAASVNFTVTQQHGSLENVGGTGAFVYTPHPGFSGTETLSYVFSAASLVSNEAAVTIQVVPAPTLSLSFNVAPSSGAAPLHATLTASVAGTATGTINYTFWWNCSHPGTSVSSVAAACGNPLDAAIGAKFDGVVDNPKAVSHTYTEAGTFTAKVIAERGSAPPVEMRRTVTVIQPPTARDDSYSMVQRSSLTVTAPGLLANDTVPEGTTASVQFTVLQQHGSLQNLGGGAFVYTPSPDFTGTETLRYAFHVGGTPSNEATVRITINPAPTLTLSFAVSPQSGHAPLASTLTATVGGTAAGTINYTFWWNCSDPGTSVSAVTAVCGDPFAPAVGAKFDGISDNPKAVTRTYGAGTHVAKVIVERGAAPAAEMRRTITVTPPPPAVHLISHNSARRGQRLVEFTVTGAHFSPTAALRFGTSGCQDDGSIAVDYRERSSTRIVASIEAGEYADVGARSVCVSNGDSAAGLVGAFHITHRPVIVIPGLMGSHLVDAVSADRVWLNALTLAQSGCDEEVLPMALASDGVAPAGPFTASCDGVLREHAGAYLVPDGILDGGLVANYYGHLKQQLLSVGLPTYVFAYDWRRQFSMSALPLRALIESLTQQQSETVDIVAHSQGGLVTRSYLQIFDGDHRVHTTVFIGTPHLGAPRAYAIVKGMVAAVPQLNLALGTFLSGNFPSTYGLLPRFDFLTRPDGQKEPYRATYGLGPGSPANGDLPNPPLAADADLLWTMLGGGPTAPRSFAINGSGQPTLDGLELHTGACEISPVIDPAGDGTVPQRSANGFGGTTYFFVNKEHSALPNDAVVRTAVLELLRTGSASVDHNLRTDPFRAAATVAATCSPVQMTITDPAGNVNGLDASGNLRSGIPGSTFLQFAHNEAAILPAAADSTIFLRATDDGLFGLVLEAVAEDGGVTEAARFDNVPISRTSQAAVQLGADGGTGQLMLDVDGDGSSDFTVAPGQTPPPESYCAALVETVAGFALPGGLATSLTRKVDAAAASIGRGNRIAAEHQIMAFQAEVRAQSGNGLTSGQAGVLLSVSGKAIESLR